MAAKQRLLEILNSGPIVLKSTARDEDRFGRKLRVVFRGDRSVGDILIAEGLARKWEGSRRGWCD
jgi:endonuclease YncB( thermonuclease family)